jgi:hypothetical protein
VNNELQSPAILTKGKGVTVSIEQEPGWLPQAIRTPDMTKLLCPAGTERPIRQFSSVVITKPSKIFPDPSNESMAKLIFLVQMFSVGYHPCLRVSLVCNYFARFPWRNESHFTQITRGIHDTWLKERESCLLLSRDECYVARCSILLVDRIAYNSSFKQSNRPGRGR